MQCLQLIGYNCVHGCSVAQLCLTLFDPVDCSPPGSSVHGISQARYWSGLPFPRVGDLPEPRIKLMSPALPVHALPLSQLGSP